MGVGWETEENTIGMNEVEASGIAWSNCTLQKFCSCWSINWHFALSLLLHTEPVNSCCGFDNSDSKVILALRRAEHLKKLIYVSCNPRAAMNNFVEWVFLALSCLTKCGKKKKRWFLRRGDHCWVFIGKPCYLRLTLPQEQVGAAAAGLEWYCPIHVITEILGVVNKPVIELRLGEEKPLWVAVMSNILKY